MSPFDESEEILSVFIKIPESLTIRELEDRYEKAIQQALVNTGFGPQVVHRATCADQR